MDLDIVQLFDGMLPFFPKAKLCGVFFLFFLYFFLMWRRSFWLIVGIWAALVCYGRLASWNRWFFKILGSKLLPFGVHRLSLGDILGVSGCPWALILSGGTPGRIWCAVVSKNPWCHLEALLFDRFFSIFRCFFRRFRGSFQGAFLPCVPTFAIYT